MYNIYMSIHIIHIPYIHIYVYVCMYVCMHVCMYIHVYIYIYIHTYTHTNIFTYLYVYIYIYIFFPCVHTQIERQININSAKLHIRTDFLHVSIVGYCFHMYSFP